jgi:hypothetical protein
MCHSRLVCAVKLGKTPLDVARGREQINAVAFLERALKRRHEAEESAKRKKRHY